MDEQQTPLSDWLLSCDGTVGLVFTDVVDSTMLLYARKTLNFTHMLRANRLRAAEVIGRLGGKLVDETGDGMFSAFPRATQAYAFATEMFHDPGHPDLSIRVGLHFGTVSAAANALVGRNVHLGARIMQHGEGHELWVSDAAKTALEAESPEVASGITWIANDVCRLKGVPDTQRLWRAA